jgi:hypothetical protein
MGGVSRWLPIFAFIMVASCQNQACPSTVGGTCDPRSANCPSGYTCALAEICTRTCEQTSDCWVPVSAGCRSNYFPGQLLPDGGTYTEQSEDGFCPESKVMECISGYCQRAECADGGCDYDLYGPSPFKGNRNQGPAE